MKRRTQTLQRISNQKGLTIVETLVSVALVVFIISLAQNARLQYRVEYAKSTDIIAKQKLIRGISQELQDANSQFPLIVSSSGGSSTAGTYVRCYNRSGAPVPNYTGQGGDVFVPGSEGLSHLKYSKYCVAPAGATYFPFFEVHIIRNANDPAEIAIWTINQDKLPAGPTRDLASRTVVVIPTEL